MNTRPVGEKNTEKTVQPEKTKGKSVPNWEMIVILSTVLLLLSAVILSVIGIQNHKHRLEGKWTVNETTYCFKQDRTGYLQVGKGIYHFRYGMDGNRLSICFERSDSISDCVYTFRVKGNRLYLKGEEGTLKGDYVLERQNG